MHEVVHLRVDPLDDGHQIVENVFCVVHGRIHEVPKNEDKTERFRVHNRPLLLEENGGGRVFSILTFGCLTEKGKLRKKEAESVFPRGWNYLPAQKWSTTCRK